LTVRDSGRPRGVSAKCFPLGDFIRAPHRGTPFAICTAFERRCRWRTP